MAKAILFTGGSVFDGTAFLAPGTSVLVSGGKVAAVGADLDPGGADVVDLAGGTLLPGFQDAHVHPVFGGMQLLGCDLSEAETAQEYLAIVAGFAAANPDLDWITGGGWGMTAFPGGIPTAAQLDPVSGGRPVILTNRDGHGAWVNSRAMELAGITRDTLDPADGRIERDAAGEPVGMLQEGAMNLVRHLIPADTDEDRYRGLLAAQDYLLSLGITGWQDAIIGSGFGDADAATAYHQAASAGTLRADVVGALWWQRHEGLEQLPGLLHRREHDGRDGFRLTSVKMMLDGVAENHTAAMLDPYLDGHGCATHNSGLDFIDPAELPRYVTALDQAGFQVHFHALGDRAVRNALNAVAAARAAHTGSPGRTIRHHLAHLQVVHPADIARFAELGATANIQPLWATAEEQMTELTIPFLGERRAAWQYPFRGLAASGAHLAAGSDWPVSSPNPLLGIHVAVNRSTPDSADTPFLPDQAIPLATALAAYTSGTATVNGVDGQAGRIRPGYQASFAVTDADLAAIGDHEICAAAVTQTWVRGELAYRND
ncbi:amidohydrolase [Trebonia kvetii]|uniref:amidohydrolase n=1 Tax=Trebonia kvetii TaxID=2480626 RepID=UPI001C9E3722|nr:amidohydrolase [Trebonia kvetii]